MIKYSNDNEKEEEDDDNDDDNNDTLYILGLGRVGWHVGKYCIDNQSFQTVIGTVRNKKKTTEYGRRRQQQQDDDDDNKKYSKIYPVLFNEQTLQSFAAKCRYVLITIPPSPSNENDDDTTESNGVLRSSSSLLIDTFVQQLQPKCWIGIISTTGVYGDHNGQWVTEQSECKTTTTTAVRYIDYEQKFISYSKTNHCTVIIFRCAGIYSNDQSALHTVYRNGGKIIGTTSSNNINNNNNSITNRIHVDDIAQAVVASMLQHKKNSSTNKQKTEQSSYSRIYNLADNLPENRDIVLDYAAKLLKTVNSKLSVQRDTVDTQLSTTTTTLLSSSNNNNSLDNIKKSSTRESRRMMDRKLVSNQRMVQELLPESGLIFPTYKEGLTSILNDRNNPWWG